MNTEKIQKQAAAEFAARWKDRGSEKEDSQRFWIDLLENVYGIKNVTEFVRFEEKAALDNTSFIDVMIPSTKVMIEQKSSSKDLRKPIKQSDGTMLTPFQQAQRYVLGLPVSQHPRWIVTCNFKEILVYDMENPNSEPQEILLENLGCEYYRLQFLVDTGSDHLKKEMEVSIKAGELVGRIYDDFIQEYDANDPMSLRYLNILCVRLVFCLYAEDAGIFGKHDMFHDYLAQFPTEQMREELLRVFRVLNTPEDKRSKYLRPDLAAFPYTNGGLFAEEIDVPQFTDRIRATLLLHASMGFDWSQISPTIFGGVFESTLNPETRRSGGMHYTSIENIHKVIDPLFLDDLKREFTEIMDEAVVVVEVLDVVLKHIVDKAQRIDGLEQVVFLAFLQLAHIGLGGVEEYALLESRRPLHLHLDNELPPVSGLATHVNDAVLAHRVVGSQLGREIFYFRYLLFLAEREQGVEQADYQVGMLAEYLLECQVGFRV